MFDPSRDQVREMFFEIWRKYRAGLPLAGIESLALDTVLLHPEYHDVLAMPVRSRDREYTDESNASPRRSGARSASARNPTRAPTSNVYERERRAAEYGSAGLGTGQRVLHNGWRMMDRTKKRSRPCAHSDSP